DESGKYPVNEDDEEIVRPVKTGTGDSAECREACARNSPRRCERSEAIHRTANGWMDCFASLAMTALCILAGATHHHARSRGHPHHVHKNANARDKPGHDAVFLIVSIKKAYAWLATVLP